MVNGNCISTSLTKPFSVRYKKEINMKPISQVIRSIGLHSRTSSPKRLSHIHSGTSTPNFNQTKGSNMDDIAALDKLLTSLLGQQGSRRSRSFCSHRGTPRSSRMPVINELRNRRSDSWPDRIFENSVVQSVLSNLKSQRSNSPAEDPFLTPK